MVGCRRALARLVVLSLALQTLVLDAYVAGSNKKDRGGEADDASQVQSFDGWNAHDVWPMNAMVPRNARRSRSANNISLCDLDRPKPCSTHNKDTGFG